MVRKRGAALTSVVIAPSRIGTPQRSACTDKALQVLAESDVPSLCAPQKARLDSMRRVCEAATAPRAIFLEEHSSSTMVWRRSVGSSDMGGGCWCRQQQSASRRTSVQL